MPMKKILGILLVALAVAALPASAYTIRSGDTLSRIARDNATTVDALMEANPHIQNPNRIYAGDELTIPGHEELEDLDITDMLGGSTGTTTLPLALANFETSLASKITADQTTMTLVNGTDDDGDTLNGYYGFTIDVGSPTQEYVIANCVSTACTDMIRGVSVKTGTSTVAALKSDHRRGASVQVTDHPYVVIITNILNGVEAVPDKLFYRYQPIFTNDNDIITKKYADDLTNAGAADATESVKGIAELATGAEAAAGTSSGSAARLVLPASIATSTCQVAANSVTVTDSDGQLNAGCLPLNENLTMTGNFSVPTTNTDGGFSPTGSITAYASSTAPTGWLLADGSSYATSTYPRLFSVIGYTYGGSSANFNVPNIKGRNIIGYGSATSTLDTMGEIGGEEQHTLTIGEMPPHTHAQRLYNGTPGDEKLPATQSNAAAQTGGNTASAGSGNPHNVLDPYIVLNYIIKY